MCLCSQHRCCSRQKTTSISESKLHKSKKVERIVAYLQLHSLRSFALGTTRNVTGDYAEYYYCDWLILSILFNYRYDQDKMREHFLKCLESGKMSPFPSQVVRRKRPAQIKKRLHCDCRLPDDGEEQMAFCEGCRQWFHQSCQQISDAVFNPGHKQGWFCSHCL